MEPVYLLSLCFQAKFFKKHCSWKKPRLVTLNLSKGLEEMSSLRSCFLFRSEYLFIPVLRWAKTYVHVFVCILMAPLKPMGLFTMFMAWQLRLFFVHVGTWFPFLVYITVPHQMQPQDMWFSTSVLFMSRLIFNLIKKQQMMSWRILHWAQRLLFFFGGGCYLFLLAVIFFYLKLNLTSLSKSCLIHNRGISSSSLACHLKEIMNYIKWKV